MTLVKFADLSEAVDAKLGERLFHERTVLALSGLVQIGAAAVGFTRTGHIWCLWWGFAALALLLGRIGLDIAFARRRDRIGRPTIWRRRFLIGTWATAFLCGLAGAGSILDADPLTQLLIITLSCAFVMGSAARNSAYPMAAIGSIVLTDVPVLLACLTVRDRFYFNYAIFVLLFSFVAVSMARHLYVQAVQILLTDEKSAVLADEVSRSNRDLAAANANLATANTDLAAANTDLAAANEQLATLNAKLGEANTKLASANVKFAMKPALDVLTGLPNRTKFAEQLEIETRSSGRDGSSLSLLKFNIDWFKRYNETYGDAAGDACLRTIGQTLRSGLQRPRDFVARLGGDDFVAALPLTDVHGAVIVAAKLRKLIEKLAIAHRASPLTVVTLSIGITASVVGGKPKAAELLERLDVAIRAAKGSGRNCVHIEYPPETAPLAASA